MKILIVDDEPGLVQVLEDNLQAGGYQRQSARNGIEALYWLCRERYDLILLDIKMPGMDGFEVLQKLRENDKHTPVIFLTARSEEADKVKGLLGGADDYITKPFSIPELMARIAAILRRTGKDILNKVISVKNIEIDFPSMMIARDGKRYRMNRYEVEILALLLTKPGKVFTRDEILDKIWGIDAFPDNRTVDNYIVKLRRKLEENPNQPQIIQSVYGRGYRIIC